MKDQTAGERLRAARRKAGLAADELGRRAALLLGRDKPISASAVRNQENGTNGIPTDTVQAYAEILKVSPSYIVWGDDDGDAGPEAGAPDAAAAAEQELWEQLAIPALRVVSANWLPMIIDSGKPTSEDHIVVGLPGWHASGANLKALQVIDRSLEPVFRKGSYLICAPVSEGYAFNGSYVLASWFRGEEIVHSIRLVFEASGSVHIAPAQADSGEPWVCIQETKEVDGRPQLVAADDYWIDGVVLASLAYERPAGPPIHILPPPHLTISDAESTPSIGELRRLLRDEAWPARDLDFVGIRLREPPRKRSKGG
jgi:transcriptional regulator with XRE-family HTH domain